MRWEQIDKWHLKSGDWTISKAENVPLPYCLWFQRKNLGYFETAEAAKAACMERIAMQA